MITTPDFSGLASKSFSFILSGPDLNRGVPPPRMRGLRPRRYSSIRPCRMSVEERLALPKMNKSLPGCCFNLATSSSAFALTSRVLLHSARSSVLEKTTLGMWSNTRLVRANAEEEDAKLKQQPGKDLFIFGSANLSSMLMRHGLIDEYRLGLNPLILGAGNPLFKPSPDRMKLKLLEARPLKSGVVILRYATS